jgi:hypothetical protein
MADALRGRLSGEVGLVSLPEMIWSCLLLVVVLSAALLPFDVWHQTDSRTRNQADSQDNARVTVDGVAHELRNIAGQTQLIERAANYDVVFQTVDSVPPPSGSQNSRNIMRVRYCLDSTVPSRGVLWQQTLKWTTAAAPSSMPSAASCPDLAWTGASRSILTNAITNQIAGQSRPVFSYFPTGAALTLITSLRVDLFTDRNPTDSVKEVQLTSGVLLRNQNGAPTASATSTPTGVPKQVKLDATTSTDPENLPLSYMWCDITTVSTCDGTTAIGTAQPFTYTFTQATGSIRSMRLVVTDAGGLMATYNFNVAVP